MSTIIFGGVGFIGSYIVRKLMDEGEDVIALDVRMPDPPMPPLRDVMEKVKFEYCHCEYSSEVLKMVSKYKPRHIINFVTSSLPELDMNPQRALRVHLDTQINILEAAKAFDVERVVFASSGHVYGDGRSDVVDEGSLLKPDTLYGACKAMNEYLGLYYNEHFGVDFVALRFCMTMGWGLAQRTVGWTGPWVVQLFENSLRGLPVKIPFAATKRHINYVKNMAMAVILAMRAQNLKHRVFDVVSEPHSKAEFAAVVRELIPDAKIDLDMEGAFGADLSDENPTKRVWQDKRITQEIGYQPQYSFEEGITDYITMARSNTFKW